MCGIVAVLRQPATRPAPDAAAIAASLEAAAGLGLDAALPRLQDADRLLRGTPGLRALLSSPDATARIAAAVGVMATEVRRVERELDDDASGLPVQDQEDVNTTILALKDACWVLERDRLGMARAIAELIPDGPESVLASPSALDAWWAIQVALASLDRLEVRGRDSAGIHVLVAGHGLDPADIPADRCRDPALHFRRRSASPATA